MIEVDVDVETILAVATVIVAEGFNGYVLCLNAGGWMIDKQRKVRRVVLIKKDSQARVGSGCWSGHGANLCIQMTDRRRLTMIARKCQKNRDQSGQPG